jgi:hypothetical protein
MIKNGQYMFANSDLVVRYIFATRAVPLPDAQQPSEWRIVHRLFAENSPRQIVWQEDFNSYYDEAQAREILDSWLRDFGYSVDDVVKITTLVDDPSIREQIDAARRIVEDDIRIIKIPTIIVGTERHEGLFKP